MTPDRVVISWDVTPQLHQPYGIVARRRLLLRHRVGGEHRRGALVRRARPGRRRREPHQLPARGPGRPAGRHRDPDPPRPQPAAVARRGHRRAGPAGRPGRGPAAEPDLGSQALRSPRLLSEDPPLPRSDPMPEASTAHVHRPRRAIGWTCRSSPRPKARRAGEHRQAAVRDRRWSPTTPASRTPPRAASAITYIDGDAGILRYRGYPIDQLAEHSTFLEVSYLLIYGELPTHRRAEPIHRRHPAAHPAARGPEAVLRRLPPRRAPDAGAVVGGLGAVDLLPGLAQPVRRRAGRAVDRPAAGQAADDRRLRLQEVGRPAVPLPGQLPRAWSRTSCG